MDNSPIFQLSTNLGIVNIFSKHISANEYIEFLSRTDLGKQYPKERCHDRIEKLVKNTQISLVAYNPNEEIICICFGLTDFAYWLMVTDLGIDREYVKNGIGKKNYLILQGNIPVERKI